MESLECLLNMSSKMREIDEAMDEIRADHPQIYFIMNQLVELTSALIRDVKRLRKPIAKKKPVKKGAKR
jgi:hypothetical protein